MSFARALGRRLVLATLFVFALSLSVRSDELADFHAAVERATAEHRAAMTTLETSGQQETAAGGQRIWQTWAGADGRLPPAHPPPPLRHAKDPPARFQPAGS